MKKLICTLVLLSPFMANATTKIVEGELSRDLISVAEALGAADAGMGHVYAFMYDVICTKTVNDVDGTIKCDLRPLESTANIVSISTKNQDQADNAVRLRRLLLNITGGDTKLSDTERQLKIKSVQCSMLGWPIELEDIDLESLPKCTLEF